MHVIGLIYLPQTYIITIGDIYMKIQHITVLSVYLIFLLGCSNNKSDTAVDVGCKSQLTESCEGYILSVNDIEMYFEIHGEGEPLLLIHGGTGFIESFAPQLIALSQHFKVIAPDSRAHGRTTDSEQPLGYTLMANDKVALLNHLYIEQVDLVGWSDGGIIGLEMAINHARYLKRVVAIGTNYHTDGIFPEVKEAIRNLSAEQWPQESREFYKSVAADPDQWPIFLDKVREMWFTQPNYSDNDLKNIQNPFLIIVGEDEDFILESHTRKMAELIPNSILTLIPEGTHYVPLEKPGEVNTALLNFLVD